jgi:predicted cupin superfamily sugar epimerase
MAVASQIYAKAPCFADCFIQLLATPCSAVGCTVTPGFDFAEWEDGERSKLLVEFPHADDLILRLTAEP